MDGARREARRHVSQMGAWWRRALAVEDSRSAGERASKCARLARWRRALRLRSVRWSIVRMQAVPREQWHWRLTIGIIRRAGASRGVGGQLHGERGSSSGARTGEVAVWREVAEGRSRTGKRSLCHGRGH